MKNDEQKNFRKPGYNTAEGDFYKKIKDLRREYKNNLTQAEEHLWQKLRRNEAGYKIRRQHIVAHYIADFICLPLMLIIEIDGPVHNKQKEKDAERTENLKALGYKVIRYANDEVENNIETVVERIKEELRQREIEIKLTNNVNK